MSRPSSFPGSPPCLLIVTANYPFERPGGEIAFLPPEIEALARQPGLRLRVAPLRTSGRSLPLPAGVELDESLARTIRARRWRDQLSAWRWPGCPAELLRALRHGGLVGLLRVWRWAASARTCRHWLQRQPLDGVAVAYTYWRGGPTLAFARWAAEREGRAAITRVHRYELYDDCFRPPFQPWVSVYRELRCTVAVSEHGRAYLEAGGIPASRLSLARLGVAAGLGRARPSADGVLRVLSCSFLRPEKRVPLLARALARLAARHPARRFVWTHLGDGPGRRSVEIEAAAAPPNLQIVLGGQVRNEQVRAHYATQAVDLFVQVSASEGLPVAIMEALSAGVPVIAADVGGVAEAVDGEVGALLPPAPDADAVADAIESLGVLASDERRRTLRDAASARWAERFDARRNHAVFGAWLYALVESQAAPEMRPDGAQLQESWPRASS